jgi:ParB family chromosome partitioning protein
MSEDLPLELPSMPKAHGLIDVDSIIIPERIRSEDTKETKDNIKQLYDSIRVRGLIQPIVLDDDEKTLLAGWCRLSACKLLGYKQIAFSVRGELSPSEKLIVEFEENSHRGEMSWQDQVCAVDRIHNMMRIEHKARSQNWSVAATGRLLKQAAGRVSYCTVLAKAIKSGNTYISNAENISEAIKRLAEQKQAEIERKQAELGPAALPTVALRKRDTTESGFVTSESSGVLSSISLSQPRAKTIDDVFDDISDISPEDIDTSFALDQILTLKPSEYIYQGKMEEICETYFHSETFDFIFTDIPYGISIDKMKSSMDNLDLVAPEHDVDVFLTAAPLWLKTMYRVLKDNSYCIFFYDICHHEKLVAWAEAAGFSVQPYPFIWLKTHPCANQNAGVWFTKTIEYVMICRKGRGTMRSSSYAPCFMESSGSVDRQLYTHPFFKPFDLCTHLLRIFTFRGMKMLDPFAGEGSILKAAIYHGLVPYGIELSDTWHPKLLSTFRNTYQEIYKNRVQFT